MSDENRLSRRQLLVRGGGGVSLIAGGVGTYNEILGYDRLTGTNVVRQDLDPIVSEHLGAATDTLTTVSGRHIDHENGALTVQEVAVSNGSEAGNGPSTLTSFEWSETSPAEAAKLDEELGLDTEGSPLEQLTTDLSALEATEIDFVYGTLAEFFEYAREGESRPYTVDALRGRVGGVDPGVLEEFTGTPASDVEALIDGLADGFQEFTTYDASRYLAGSLEDNVLFGRGDLRARFESPADFTAIVGGENDGLDCTEMSRRTIEAVHTAHPLEQTVPVVAGYVRDLRHSHFYVTLATVTRVDGELVIPVTFVDYMYTTLVDDFRLDRLARVDPSAYDRYHRADEIRWFS
ncbi:hypothetical protein EA462_00345 [Natrarchaeobius halalkaliphilus]|uniref:Uncharacterized protein n=1 Tax=Natrarchaeobius halalkaliphilus TaxID=1679091 RepID=A0A3N6P487_9EURY|nr:hypothetical protein [Natrarchaeobius halalkaliphilus]RQG92719.1 hypothetical protein EA462_00345 [Natrarchaeobius halalkaliphilus]